MFVDCPFFEALIQVDIGLYTLIQADEEMQESHRLIWKYTTL